jgi:hypothetical protein
MDEIRVPIEDLTTSTPYPEPMKADAPNLLGHARLTF